MYATNIYFESHMSLKSIYYTKFLSVWQKANSVDNAFICVANFDLLVYGCGCKALAADCWAWRDRSTQVNRIQLNKHTLSKTKFPLQSASFLLALSVHLADDLKGWDDGCVHFQLVTSVHMQWLYWDHDRGIKKLWWKCWNLGIPFCLFYVNPKNWFAMLHLKCLLKDASITFSFHAIWTR